MKKLLYMPDSAQKFKIAIGAILGILGFTVGMVFIGILLIEILGPNGNWIWFGGVVGSVLSIYGGFKIFIQNSDKKTIPYKEKQVKKDYKLY